MSRRATRPKRPRRMLKAFVKVDLQPEVYGSGLASLRIARIAGDRYVSAAKKSSEVINPPRRSKARASDAGRQIATRERTMDVVFQDAGRDRREQQRQRQFRDRFIAETPPWYHGALHLGFTLLVTGVAMWLCWTRIHNAGWLWL